MLKGFQNIVCQHLQKSNLCYEFRIWYLEGFNCIYNCQDQEELIMMMDFKDGAQRVISNSSSTTWEDYDKNLLVFRWGRGGGSLGNKISDTSQLHHLFICFLSHLQQSCNPKRPLWKCFSLNTLSLSQPEVLSCNNEPILGLTTHIPDILQLWCPLSLCSFCKFGWKTLFLIYSIKCQPSILSSFQKPVQRALTQHCPQIFLNQHCAFSFICVAQPITLNCA